MCARRPAPWIRIVLGALVLTIGFGVGLPGIARALAQTRNHVCTCASGGAHASCPVCNHSLASRRSGVIEVNGVPCGDRPLGIGDARDLAVVRQPCELLVARFVRASARRDGLISLDWVSAEPPTPPPRFAAA